MDAKDEALVWLVEFVVEQWGDSIVVVRESLESMGAPEPVLSVLDSLNEGT